MPLRNLGAVLVVALTLADAAHAWDGVDADTGGTVEIDKGNLVRPGLDIEVYDADAGGYRDVEVQSIRRFGSSVEVEVYDSEAGEYRTFEMDD